MDNEDRNEQSKAFIGIRWNRVKERSFFIGREETEV